MMNISISKYWTGRSDTIRKWSIGVCLCAAASGLVYAAAHRQEPTGTVVVAKPMARIVADPMELDHLFAEIAEQEPPRIVAGPAANASKANVPAKTEINRQPGKKARVAKPASERFDRCATTCASQNPRAIARNTGPLPPTRPAELTASVAPQPPTRKTELTGGQRMLADGRHAFNQLVNAPRTTLEIGHDVMSRMASAIW